MTGGAIGFIGCENDRGGVCAGWLKPFTTGTRGLNGDVCFGWTCLTWLGILVGLGCTMFALCEAVPLIMD
jgi:hypothetical protein